MCQVVNLVKLERRLRSDLAFLDACCSQALAPAPPPATPAPGPRVRQLTPARCQGIANNLRGFAGELLAAQEVEGLVGLLQRFTSQPCRSWPAPACPPNPLPAAARCCGPACRYPKGGAATDLRAAAAAAGGGGPGCCWRWPPP